MRNYETSPTQEQFEITASQIAMPDDLLRHKLAERFDAYDIFSAEAEHLRPHQTEGVKAFVDIASAVVRGEEPNKGMSLLHPTGSGKTVTAGEIVRIVTSDKLGSLELKALMLVPGYQALNQTTGNGDEIGTIQAFAPDITVGEYSGKKKETGAQLTVMNYQALRSAIARGDIDAINPALIICDEAHHVIDGKWAEDVIKISQGRLLLGQTATPAYTTSRNVQRLFPNTLAQKTLREGIEEGILAEMRGFLYQGSSKLVVARGRKDYSDEEIFAAIADSKDNYLAAAICAGEVAQGRRGIVSCAPGFDRAHAKIMAKILNHTPVKTKKGQKYIRAAYVDGETHEANLKKIFNQYKSGQIDVLTYVDLLLEGWDSPETEFGVMLRPTKSRVLAEQRIGRVVRPYNDKTATIHEIIYEIVGDSQTQQTHLNVLDDEATVKQGRYYGKPWGNKGGRMPTSPGNDRIFDVDQFAVDSGLIAAMTRRKHEAIEGASVEADQDSIPFSWSTSHVLASRFNISREEAANILESNGVTERTQTVNGVEHTYYSPAATSVIAKELGVEQLPDGPERPLTINEIVDYIRDNSYTTRMRSQTVKEHLERAGISPTMYITADNKVVMAYPFNSRNVPFQRTGQRAYQEPEQLDRSVIEAVPELEVVNWLAKILVNPEDAPTVQARKRIILGQSCLLAAMRDKKKEDEQDYEHLAIELSQLNITPNPQMQNVMETKELSFLELILLASSARQKFDRLDRSDYRRAA